MKKPVNGKGDKPRVSNWAKYRRNLGKIDMKKKGAK